MDRTEGDKAALRQYAGRKLLRLVVGIPLTWAVIFLMWIIPLGLILTASGERPQHLVDLVMFGGLFLASALTPLLSIEPLLDSVHDILVQYNQQVHLAKMDSEGVDSISRRRGG